MEGTEKSFLVLGTMHILPLEIYPKHLVDTLFRQTVLVTESQHFQSYPEQDCAEESKGDVEVESTGALQQKDMELADWLEELPTRVRYFLADIFGDSMNLQSQPEEIYATVGTLMSSKGMDFDLINQYKSLGRTILGLETDEDVVEAMMDSGEAETRYEIVCGLTELAEESLAYGGLFASPDPISEMKSHLLDNDLDSLEYQPSVHKRNTNWMPRLLAILDTYPTEILLDVGLSHLFAEGGLLTAMSEDGWNVGRANLGGEFNAFDLQKLIS